MYTLAMVEQPDASRHRPDPEVRGPIEVQYKDDEPRRFTIPVKHFVDAWYTTTFAFKLTGGTAELYSIEAPGDTYYVRQNQEAREFVEERAEQLPFVQAVDMFGEYNAE